MSHTKDYANMGLASKAVHAGEIHDSSGAHIAPIYQTSTFTFEDMAAVDKFAAGDPNAYIYTRIGNPNRKALAEKLAALEGHTLIKAAREKGETGPVVKAELFTTGMAAINAAIMAAAKAGDHIIAQDALYGGTDGLIFDLLPHYNVTSTRLNNMDADTLAAALKEHPNTTVVFIETPANPTMRLVDMTAIASVAHEYGAMVIADNTFATPMLQRPLELGIDVVVHSTTKYIGGHGVILGGAVISTNLAYMTEKVAKMVKLVGGTPSPFDTWLTNLGLKTLPLRMPKHCSNAMAVAKMLDAHPMVDIVHYPGLESFPQHELAKKQMADFGGMLAFELKGGYEAGVKLMESVNLMTLAVSLGNVDTLVEHPASMTHRGVPEAERVKAGLTNGLIRISVGIEDEADLLNDLSQALDQLS